MAVEIALPERRNLGDPMAYLRLEAEMAKADLRPRPQQSQIPTANPPQTSSETEDSPLEGQYRMSQAFGNENRALYAGKTAGARHYGLDLATPTGTKIRSPFTGVVNYGTNKDFGNFVEVKAQDGRVMRFSHLSGVDDLVRQLAQAGQAIQSGQALGLTGNTGNSTGPHLDIMYQQNGQYINPLAYEPLKRSLL